jgi:hypothetical protein
MFLRFGWQFSREPDPWSKLYLLWKIGRDETKLKTKQEKTSPGTNCILIWFISSYASVLRLGLING